MTNLEDILLSTKYYPYKSWTFIKHMSLSKLYIQDSWKDLFNKQNIKKYLKQIEKDISYCLKKKVNIYPYPDLVFYAFTMTPLHKVKVVILGLEPYIQTEIHNNKIIPRAMGLSFSIPYGMKLPSSLKNIYKNLVKFKHLEKTPEHGNLMSWALQGCLMLNTRLLIDDGKCLNQKYWNPLIDNIIKYISNQCNHIIFILLGDTALKKLDFVDKTKHKVIISSHPSGQSYNNKLKEYESFRKVDHFGLTNKYLKEYNKKTIKWGLL